MTQRIRIANSDLVTISNVCSWPNSAPRRRTLAGPKRTSSFRRTDYVLPLAAASYLSKSNWRAARSSSEMPLPKSTTIPLMR